MKTIQSMKGFLFYVAAVVFVTAAVLLLAGCMDPLGREATAPTGISVMNAPSTVTELDLTVSGPGMSTIQRTLTPSTSSVTLEVPVGVNRVFDLTGGWFTFRRSFSVSPAGLSVPANMGSYIVVPDAQNNRIVLIKDMTGAGWMTIPGEQFSVPGIESWGFDRAGRFVFDNFDFPYYFDDPVSAMIPGVLTGVSFDYATIDFESNRLYFLVGSEGWQVGFLDLSVPSPAPQYFDGTYNGSPTAITVDGSGNLYIAGYTEGQSRGGVDKFNTSTGQVVASFTDETIFGAEGAPNDITFVNGSVFALYRSGPPDYQVLKLNSSLQLTGHFGSFPSNPDAPQPGEFFGPYRFVATVPRKVIVMDGGIGYDFRLVEIADTNTSVWRAFGQYGTGEGEFWFFC